MVDGTFTLVLPLPSGLNWDNCAIISSMFKRDDGQATGYTEGFYPSSIGYNNGALAKSITITQENTLKVIVNNPASFGQGTGAFSLKAILMKI